MIRKSLIACLLSLLVWPLFAQEQDQAPDRKWTYVDASTLTFVGKLFPDTPNPYHRVDTQVYGGFTESELRQVHQSSGIGIAFRTDSEGIAVLPEYGQIYGGGNTAPNAKQGFDLYIKKDGKWKWAGAYSGGKSGAARPLLRFNDTGRMYDCIIYLPVFAELTSLKIGVYDDSWIEPLEKPFRHRIGVFGSSYTQGYGVSRPSMGWTSQLSRMTGMDFLCLGCSGNSRLQPYFAKALADADVDAFVFDGFSNPTPEMIQANLFEFISIIQAKHPGKPLIFLKTIHRAWCDFNSETARKEVEKMRMADVMMRKATKKFKDVYYVTTTSATDDRTDTTTDGTHPGDYGYFLWAESVKDPILEILAKYDIR